MDWALVTWGILVGMVGLLWIMVIASVQDSHADETNNQDTSDDAAQPHEQYERHAAA